MRMAKRSVASNVEELPTDDMNRSTRQPKRQASVYDAVAGRMNIDRFSDQSSQRIKSHNGFPSREFLASPLDVLLRRVAAPTSGRSDVYFADQHLKPGQRLPDSELLKALHAYASDFYSIATPKKGQGDFRTLDETALIALGVLVEEAAVQAFGENGDMVFVEPEGFANFMPETRATQLQVHGRVPRTETPPYVSEQSSDGSEDEYSRPRKRRRPDEEKTPWHEKGHREG